MYKALLIVALMAGLAAGAWWGRHQARAEAAPIAELPSPAPYAPTTAISAVAGSIDRSALRTMLREERPPAVNAGSGPMG